MEWYNKRLLLIRQSFFSRCPQEVLKFRKFSHASDVWAFGITVLELFSYGVEPWPGLNGAEVSATVHVHYFVAIDGFYFQCSCVVHIHASSWPHS